ncbi:MAG: hypothetical protein RR400_03575 [Clostridia bacterium]
MKKRIFSAGLLICVCAFALAGCGDEARDDFWTEDHNAIKVVLEDSVLKPFVSAGQNIEYKNPEIAGAISANNGEFASLRLDYENFVDLTLTDFVREYEIFVYTPIFKKQKSKSLESKMDNLVVSTQDFKSKVEAFNLEKEAFIASVEVGFDKDGAIELNKLQTFKKQFIPLFESAISINMAFSEVLKEGYCGSKTVEDVIKNKDINDYKTILISEKSKFANDVYLTYFKENGGIFAKELPNDCYLNFKTVANLEIPKEKSAKLKETGFDDKARLQLINDQKFFSDFDVLRAREHKFLNEVEYDFNWKSNILPNSLENNILLDKYREFESFIFASSRFKGSISALVGLFN